MLSQAGVGRDGTRAAQKSYIDALWCRWYQGVPRKMGGYVEQLRGVNGVVRAIDVFSNDGYSYVHLATGNAIQRYAIDITSGANTGLLTRTPAGYPTNPEFNWQFSQLFDIPTDTTMIFASGTPSATSITTSSEHPVYYGDIIGVEPLTPIPDGVLFTGAISGTTLTITGATNTTLVEGDTIYGAAPGTVIVAMAPIAPYTGTGGNGTYEVSISQTVAATAMTAHQVRASGGCCAVPPYLFLYGHDGIVRWSSTASPTDFESEGTGDARPVGDKIVRAMPLRGQSGPAIIMWSLGSVIIGSFVGQPAYWDFTTVTTNSSVLSSNGFVEHEGIYYWATTSGFTLFNGVVREMPNIDNRQWFLDNLNWEERQKVFAFKIPRWSEIWWCFPFGNATECTHAVIYNWAEKKWYDTVLPNGGRSAGHYEFVYHHPIMAGIVPNEDTAGGTSMWRHEFEYDEVSGAVSIPRAIRSYFQTGEFSMVMPQQPGTLGADQGQSLSVMEPDFSQTGPLEFTIVSRANARAHERISGPYTIVPAPCKPAEQLIRFKHTGRLNSFRIESNWLGGNYVTGAPLIHWQPGDARRED
jgi:hypothetical protein